MLEIKNGVFELKPMPNQAGQIFKAVTKRLKKKKINYWVSAGTALGLYRDGDFIKGDTDLDIAMVWEPGLERKICDLIGGEVIRTAYENGKPMQIAMIKEGVIVDIYFHHRVGEEIENHSQSGWTRMRANICTDPKWMKTKYGLLPIPKEAYFEIRYGDDWMIPQNKKPKFYEV